MTEMSAQDLKSRLDGGKPPTLLDVRQDWETKLCRLENAVHIPIEDAMRRVVQQGLPARAQEPGIIAGRSGRQVNLGGAALRVHVRDTQAAIGLGFPFPHQARRASPVQRAFPLGHLR